jgi:hypothetical protein
MASRRCRRIDDHQPQLMGGTGTQVEQQVVALTWPTVQQCAGPVDRTVARGLTFALLAVIEASGAGSGIRPRVRARANA